jgi:hypothetical protein
LAGRRARVGSKRKRRVHNNNSVMGTYADAARRARIVQPARRRIVVISIAAARRTNGFNIRASRHDCGQNVPKISSGSPVTCSSRRPQFRAAELFPNPSALCSRSSRRHTQHLGRYWHEPPLNWKTLVACPSTPPNCLCTLDSATARPDCPSPRQAPAISIAQSRFQRGNPLRVRAQIFRRALASSSGTLCALP